MTGMDRARLAETGRPGDAENVPGPDTEGVNFDAHGL